MRPRATAPLAPLLAAALLAAACGELAERAFTPPSAVVQDVAIQGASLEGPTLIVALRLANENTFPLTATGARYRLVLADSTEVGSGSSAERVTIGARDTAVVRLPVTLSWNALGGAGRDLLGGGDVEVQVLGEVMVDTPVGEHAVPLRARSRVRGLRR